MKKIVIAAATLAAFATTSYAADLPARMPVKAMPAPVVQSWTGCYVGLGAGGGMWNQDHTTTDPFGTTPRTTTGGRGYFGTAQFGCDYQFDQNWVIGAFVDGNWGSMRGDLQDVGPGFAPIYGREREKWSWAGGGRVGYLIYPQLLGYVSAGYTAAHFDQVNMLTFAGAASSYYPRHTYDGWFLGTGYEYKLTWFPGLTWKTEYRVSDFGTDTLARYTPAGALTTVTLNSRMYEQTIRSELVWRFNWWR
jgi:outer membrane immunogenic protein